MNAKSPTLEQLRQTPHWSYSRLNGLLGFCSLAWAFKYVYGESPEFTPVSLVFGSAFHSALALAFDEKRRTGAVSPERATELFRDRIAGELKSNRLPKVRLNEKTTRESLSQLGTRMIEIYLDQLDPEERIVDVSVPFTVALPGVEKPLIGEFDAIVLASAGLERLGLAERITARLGPPEFVPAGGQGAVGIECRSDDVEVRQLLAALDDEVTSRCVRAERSVSRHLGGNCSVPLASHAIDAGGELSLTALVASLDGGKVLRAEGRGGDPEALGIAVAEDLLAAGAGPLLEEAMRLSEG